VVYLMVGAANERAGYDVVSDADDSANDADDMDDAADEDVVVCMATGSIADANDLDDDCWNSLGGTREWYATAALLRHSISLPLPKTLGSPLV
jgi:hypothetical protein